MRGRASWIGVLLVIGCGPSNPEPLLVPGPLASIATSAEPVVVCPVGSQWDAGKQVCLAVQEVPEPRPEEPPKPTPVAQGAGSGTVRVTCAFPNGWVSVMPANKYPRDDQFLMQALIGLTEEPSFWQKEPEYVRLTPYKAKKCSAAAVSFEVAKGSYFLLAGEAGTFGARGQYTKNGYRKKVDLDPASPTAVDLKPGDLTHTWLCISCPWVSFFDPAKEGEGSAPRGGYLPSFVVLKDRRSREDKGTDRVATSSVPVKDGKVRLRVVEAEHEVTHLDRLTLEIEGRSVSPSVAGGASAGIRAVSGAPAGRSALALEDGIEVEMARGRMIEVTYDVPGVADGVYPGTVIATGYYVPTLD